MTTDQDEQTAVTLTFRSPSGARENLTPEQVRAGLETYHGITPFDRLAGTPLDDGPVCENPYWDLVRLAPRSSLGYSPDPWEIDWFGFDGPSVYRQDMTALYAWSIPSPADLGWMLDQLDGRGVIEIGAGNGYWAWLLRQLGVDVTAVDDGSWRRAWKAVWSHVATGGPETAAAHPDRALLLIWPPHGAAMAAQSLAAYTGDLVIYAGEGDGGATGDDDFHDALETGWEPISRAPHHPTYYGIHCRLTAYRRRTRRALTPLLSIAEFEDHNRMPIPTGDAVADRWALACFRMACVIEATNTDQRLSEVAAARWSDWAREEESARDVRENAVTPAELAEIQRQDEEDMAESDRLEAKYFTTGSA